MEANQCSLMWFQNLNKTFKSIVLYSALRLTDTIPVIDTIVIGILYRPLNSGEIRIKFGYIKLY